MFNKVLNLIIVISILGFIGCNSKSGKSGKSYYLNIGSEPATINPLASGDVPAATVQGYIVEGLLDRDLDTYEWKPALATEWEISKDNKVFTFKLRKGVKWHDGKDFTAHDVKYSYDVIFTDEYKAIQTRVYYEAVKSVTVIDDYTVRF